MSTPKRHALAKPRHVTRKPGRTLKPYHHGDLRRALLDGARALISEQGTEGFTLREVARRAGVSHNAPYRHFKNVSDVLHALAAEGYLRLAEALRATVADTSAGTLAQVEALGVTYVRFALENPLEFQLMRYGQSQPGRAGQQPEFVAQASLVALEVLLEAVRAAQASGAMRLGDARAIGNFNWVVVHGLATVLVDGLWGPHPLDVAWGVHYAQTSLRLMVEGLGPGAPALG